MLVPEITNNYQVLACYGTNGFTEEHTEAIKSLENLIEIILFFDGDKAGKEGIKKNAEIIRKLKPKYQDTSCRYTRGRRYQQPIGWS
jgi:DNA primase